jgi:CHAT domain-containing protein
MLKQIFNLFGFKTYRISQAISSKGEWNSRLHKQSPPARTGNTELHSNIVDRKDREDKEDKEDKGKKVLYTNATSYKPKRSLKQIWYKSYKRKITKTLFVLLFIASFCFVQGEAWLFGVGSLPVVAQTPAEVTNTQEVTNPEALVQQAKKLYREEQFTQALSLLEQAAKAFAAKGEVLKQAMTLDLQGQINLAQGQSETAVENFSSAATLYEQSREKTSAIKSLINQAQALRQAGFYRRALDLLEELNKNIPNEIDPQLKAIALRSLGITQRLIGDLSKAETSINESLKIAESDNSPKRQENISAAYLMLGNIAKDRGNAAKQQNESAESAQQFQAAIDNYKKAADSATTPTAKIEAQLNALSVFGDRGIEFGDAERQLLREVRETIDTLPLSRTAIHARINWARMVMEPKNQANVSPQDIAQQLAIALEQASKLKDTRSESYALGQLGELRKNLGDLEQARGNTQQALAIAQSIGASDIAYRWQWQLAQILKEQGKTEDAIASYGAAVNNLKDLRGDMVSLNPDAQFSFRDSVEPVYREYAGLLLQSGDLKNARTAIESLQQAELVNFFRENCITSQSSSVDELLAKTDQKAALIYPMVLENQLEVVVTLPNPDKSKSTEPILRHYSSTLNQEQVEGILADLRQRTLNSRTAGLIIEGTPEASPDQRQDYLPLAQQVYGWFIKPFEKDLENSDVKTLVFVLDAPLLNLPMAVLHDGEKFLVEKYAIAQTPGLQLLDSKPLEPGELSVLKGGLSEPRGEFGELPKVKEELESLADKLEIPGKLMLNGDFTNAAIQNAIDSAPFPVVHLATHGQFSSNAAETFILTWDGRLNIDQLKELLKGREAGGRNAIELLVLSACETATGDKRAALGLAGVAVKAGARSTLATLWQVDDEGTAELMIRFYQHLKNTTISKAEALGRAQRSFIEQPEGSKFREPYYWAPFILVGNWL